MRQFGAKFGQKIGVVLVFGISRLEFFDRQRQRFGNEGTAIRAKVPMGIGLVIGRHGKSFQSGHAMRSISRAHGSHKGLNFVGVFDALGGFHTRADID